MSVAAVAPAYAASCNRRTNQVLDWDGPNVTYVRTSATEAYALYDPDLTGPLPALRLDVKAAYAGNMKAGNEFNNDTSQTMVVQAVVGGIAMSGLGFMQATTSAAPTNTKGEPDGYGDRGTYTFTFGQPVSNLVFTLTDIDSTSNDFRDALVISGGFTPEFTAPGVELFVNNANGNGNQTTPDRWYQSVSASAAVDDTAGSNGNLRVKFAGPVSTFAITYWNRQSAYDAGTDTNQRIFVSDMTFDYKPC
ncbi:hypothetical protein [Nocardioides zhouii]|uniref:Uncharacterized protein n=1 Tax=Nocardioides zhouii TaxID=1168729 RepID=A0A4Q2SNM4_9ACTN|nr:hypothetical protein [Nocardioides zhouii]RYC05814.1 hypothetical protein EUA94_17270 [Nocardioides zhouii]